MIVHYNGKLVGIGSGYGSLFPTPYTFSSGACPHCGGGAYVIWGIGENDPDDFISCHDKACQGYNPEEYEEEE